MEKLSIEQTESTKYYKKLKGYLVLQVCIIYHDAETRQQILSATYHYRSHWQEFNILWQLLLLYQLPSVTTIRVLCFLLRPSLQVPSKCRQWKGWRSRESSNPFTPVPTSTCTDSISSYKKEVSLSVPRLQQSQPIAQFFFPKLLYVAANSPPSCMLTLIHQVGNDKRQTCRDHWQT